MWFRGLWTARPRFGQGMAARLPFPRCQPSTDESTRAAVDPYRLTRFKTFSCAVLGKAPPHWRDPAAELWLRRKDAPGPASEHVFQYQLSAKAREGAGRPTVAKGADLFYARQYRQYLTAEMGVFAMTAEVALLACGARPRGALWNRHRPVYAAMLEEVEGASPIIVLDHQTVAVPVLLPAPASSDEEAAIENWLAGDEPMPCVYRDLVQGDEVACATGGARARRRTAAGALIEVVNAVQDGGKLAILALHPHDPDAMGLHITLFATGILTAEALEHDYALEADDLYPWRYAAWAQQRLLRFCVGGVEEAFTQCSQNLFIKRRASSSNARPRATWPNAWTPSEPLDRLIRSQFELFQLTVSASGLPGASPRNGDIGKAAFVEQKGRNSIVLIPYFTGNAVHGHAAKLWSNPQGALVVWDDHTALSSITIKGRARVVEHAVVERRFSQIARKISARRKSNGSSAPDPEYWFEQEVSEIIQQDEPLRPTVLDPARPTCSIHAAGQALHGKKPAYFAAETLAPYDQKLQHAREAEGRPKDPSGVSRRYWKWESAPVLAARLAHLQRQQESA